MSLLRGAIAVRVEVLALNDLVLTLRMCLRQVSLQREVTVVSLSKDNFVASQSSC